MEATKFQHNEAKSPSVPARQTAKPELLRAHVTKPFKTSAGSNSLSYIK